MSFKAKQYDYAYCFRCWHAKKVQSTNENLVAHTRAQLKTFNYSEVTIPLY